MPRYRQTPVGELSDGSLGMLPSLDSRKSVWAANPWVIMVAVTLIVAIIGTAIVSVVRPGDDPLLTVLGLVGDVIGTVTGLLGVWFYFESERLNRDSSELLQRTEAQVGEVRDRLAPLAQTTIQELLEQSRALIERRPPSVGAYSSMDGEDDTKARLARDNEALREKTELLQSKLESVENMLAVQPRGAGPGPLSGPEYLVVTGQAGDARGRKRAVPVYQMLDDDEPIAELAVGTEVVFDRNRFSLGLTEKYGRIPVRAQGGRAFYIARSTVESSGRPH